MLGETLALGAALNWAVSIILFRKSEQFTPQGINLFKNVTALFLLLLTMAALGIGFDSERPAIDGWRLVLSGVIGVGIADTFLFMGLRRLGASLYGVINCAYAPMLVALSAIFLGEPLSLGFLLGGSLVVGGVLLVATENLGKREALPSGDPKPANGRDNHPSTRISVGVFWCLLGIFAMAVAVVLAKPALADAHLVEATAIRIAAGVAAQLVWIGAAPSQRKALNVFRPDPAWRALIPGSLLGSYVAMLLWLGGFKWAPASVAAVLNQLSSVFMIILARVFLKEPLTPKRALGAALAIGGAIWIVAGD